MYERTKAAGAIQNTYFRTAEFSSFIQETEGMLKKFLNVPDEYHTIFLASSGTGAMESVLLNCFTPDDKMLIINGGTFSAYFIDLCNYQNIPFETVDVPFGKTLTAENLLPYENRGYTALLVNIHETSTGQLYDKKMLRDFCRRNGMYYVVDAISSVCADELNVGFYDMDAVMLSSQKGFALPPGLGIVLIGNRLYDERAANNKISSLYFDFKEYTKNMTRFQTPFTPVIGILYQLNDMLKFLLKSGAETVAANTYELANYFRTEIKKFGLKILAHPLSNAMTPIYLDDISALEVHNVLKNKYGIMTNPSGLRPENLLRVGHLGNLNKNDYNILLSALKAVFEELKI